MARLGKEKGKGYTWYWWVPIVILGISSLVFIFSRSREPNKSEEIVTIDSSRHVVIPTGTPVAVMRALPVQDRDVETVGDRIAEAIVYIKKRQTPAAMRAIQQAQLATNRALSVRERTGASDKDLVTTLNELAAAEHAIQRGALDDAVRQLNALNRRLDTLAR